jgi:hypothetical protein
LEPPVRALFSIPGALPIFAAFRMLRHARRLDAEERSALRTERENLDDLKERFEADREAILAELNRRGRELERREASLTDRLIRLREWMEFPLDSEGDSETNAGGDAGTNPASSPGTEADAERIRRLDRAAAGVVRERTEQIFERVKRGDYAIDGEFHRERLVTDLIDIFESVARVYNPGSARPLLETSLEQLLRSVGRASLQLLVFLDGLPLKLQGMNLRSAYDNVQRGVKVYDFYRYAKPFWDKSLTARWAGRIAMAANPVASLGWIVLQEGAIIGARKLSEQMLNRYALGLVHELAFIVGAEAAGIFGGDFRHREPDWIYGAELTELLRRVSPTRDTLRKGLDEVGRLRLRSEYDRVFLYRCLASGRSAGPARYDCRGILSLPERQRIAERLEAFLKKYAESAPDTADRWVEAVEERLGVRMRVDGEISAGDVSEQARDALGSLAGFLLEIKGFRSEALGDFLADSRCGKCLADESGPTAPEAALAAIAAEPPMLFDYPGLDPDGPVADAFLDDLADFCVRAPPRGRGERDVLESAARYFRRKDLKSRLKRIDRAYVDRLAEQLSEESPERRVRPGIARAILGLLEGEETADFLYRDIRIEGVVGMPVSDLWLLGTAGRLRLVHLAEESEEKRPSAPVLWEALPGDGEDGIRLAFENGRLGGHCRISGGRWWTGDANGVLRISGPALSSRERFYRPLRRFAGLGED